MRSACAYVLVAVSIYVGCVNVMRYIVYADAYHVPFQSSGHHLTEHLLASDMRNAEYRYRRIDPSTFYQALGLLYTNRTVWLPPDLPLEVSRIQEATSAAVMFRDVDFAEEDIPVAELLDEAALGFFYNPLAFHADYMERHLSRNVESYVPPWPIGRYPLLLVLLAAPEAPNVDIVSVRCHQYLFFMPANHPILEMHDLD